jgi:TM2 domain-containing membrane protein YozV
MYQVTSQNIIIISHKKKIHIRSSGGERISFCPECGCSVKIENQFCESCGTALSKTGIPVPPQPYMPPPPEQAPPLTPVIPAPPQAYMPPPPEPTPPLTPVIPAPPQAYMPPPPEPTPPLTPVTTPLPGQPLPVRQKSAGLAALGSFCFSGLGQVYNGQLRKGVAIFFGTIAGMLLFVVPGIIIWIFGVRDAWQTAKKMNEGNIPFQEHSWRQIIAFFIYSFVVGYFVYSLLMVLVGIINEGVFSDMMMSY